MSPDPADSLAPRPLDPREMEYARQTVRVPAVFLIVIGVLSTIITVVGLVGLPDLPARLDEFKERIEAEPKFTNEDKDKIREALASAKQLAEDGSLRTYYIVGLVGSLLIIVGGVKLMALSGYVLPITGSVLAMIPCTANLCCVLGLPIGVWALVSLNRQVVRDAIRARRTPPANPDEQYLR